MTYIKACSFLVPFLFFESSAILESIWTSELARARERERKSFGKRVRLLNSMTRSPTHQAWISNMNKILLHFKFIGIKLENEFTCAFFASINSNCTNGTHNSQFSVSILLPFLSFLWYNSLLLLYLNSFIKV